MLRLFLFKLRRESMSLHYLKKPPYAPAFPWDSPEQVICSRYQRCRGCPYPSHGFLCWGRDRRMDRKGNPPSSETRHRMGIRALSSSTRTPADSSSFRGFPVAVT